MILETIWAAVEFGFVFNLNSFESTIFCWILGKQSGFSLIHLFGLTGFIPLVDISFVLSMLERAAILGKSWEIFLRFTLTFSMVILFLI